MPHKRHSLDKNSQDNDYDEDAMETSDITSNPSQTPIQTDDNFHNDNTMELEPWTEWIRRATRDAEHQMEATHVEGWIQRARRLKWRWAAKVAKMTPERWTIQSTLWMPQLTSHYAQRKPGHPKKRWDDDLTEMMIMTHTQRPWMNAAMDDSTWTSLEDDYVNMMRQRPS